MYYFNYKQHFWVDNLLYGEYKRETIENDFNILTYVFRAIRKCELYSRKTKMVAIIQKCRLHF